MEPQWEYVQALITDNQYHRVYRDDKLGVQMEVTTKRRNGFPVGKTRRRLFYIDGDKKEYRSEEALIAAIRAMQSEENSA